MQNFKFVRFIVIIHLTALKNMVNLCFSISSDRRRHVYCDYIKSLLYASYSFTITIFYLGVQGFTAVWYPIIVMSYCHVTSLTSEFRMRPGEACGHVPRKSVGWAIFDLIKFTKSALHRRRPHLCVHVSHGWSSERPAAPHNATEGNTTSLFSFPAGLMLRASQGLCVYHTVSKEEIAFHKFMPRFFKHFVKGQIRLFAHLLRPRIHRWILTTEMMDPWRRRWLVSVPGSRSQHANKCSFSCVDEAFRQRSARSAGVAHYHIK